MNVVLIICGLTAVVIGGGMGWLIYYLAFKRPAYRAQHYTAQTTGTVLGQSHITSSGIAVPSVEYTADGVKYKVAGPRFAGYTDKFASINGTAIGGFKCNIQPEGELPLIVHTTNGLEAAQDAVNERYPVGKQVTVFYDPARPQKAFVERDAPFPKKLGVTLSVVCGIVAAAGVIVCILGFLPS